VGKEMLKPSDPVMGMGVEQDIEKMTGEPLPLSTHPPWWVRWAVSEEARVTVAAMSLWDNNDLEGVMMVWLVWAIGRRRGDFEPFVKRPHQLRSA
jgi:hypothetical protein